TSGKFRIIPIFEKAATMAAATRGLKVMMGSGVDGSTYAHGTQALDFEALVKRAGLTPVRAIQAATVINAEVLGWQDQIGSIEAGKQADLVAFDLAAIETQPLYDVVSQIVYAAGREQVSEVWVAGKRVVHKRHALADSDGQLQKSLMASVGAWQNRCRQVLLTSGTVPAG
ncbi:MAG: amidohydrolase family protein, partial [Burkholderiaceae bacterium]